MINIFKKIIIKSLFSFCMLLQLTHSSIGSEHFDDERSRFQKKASEKKYTQKGFKRPGASILSDHPTDPRLLVDQEPPSPPKKVRPKKSSARSSLSEAPLREREQLGYKPTPELYDAFVDKAVVAVEASEEVKVSHHDFSQQTIEVLRGLGIDEKAIMLARLTNSCLYTEMRIPSDLSKSGFTLNFGLLSPGKKIAFEQLGGTEKELHDTVRLLKEERPSPIRNPEYGSKQWVYSPAARVSLKRAEVSLARKSKAVRTLPFSAHIAPTRVETLTERSEREARQRKEFLAAELLRGKSEQNLEHELNQERVIFKDYLEYVQARKQELGNGDILEDLDEEDQGEEDQGEEDIGGNAEVEEEWVDDEPEAVAVVESQGGKMTKSELEEKFIELAAPHLTHMNMNGYDLYFSRETLDLTRVQKTGHTNAEVMILLAKTPIGADGKPMNFHHLTHYDFYTHKTKSIIVLLTDSNHKEFSGLWHFGKTTFRLPLKRVTRSLFNRARQSFNKEIVKKLSPETALLLAPVLN